MSAFGLLVFIFGVVGLYFVIEEYEIFPESIAIFIVSIISIILMIGLSI